MNSPELEQAERNLSAARARYREILMPVMCIDEAAVRQHGFRQAGHKGNMVRWENAVRNLGGDPDRIH